MLEQLFSVVMEFAQRQGLNSKAATSAFARAKRELERHPYRPKNARQFETFFQISELLASWYREAAFLDESGAPRPLPRSGTKSFGTLVKRHLPSYPPERLAELMVSEKLLEPKGDDYLAPRRRTAMFPTANPMMLDRIPVLVHGLMSTVAHNASEGGRTHGTRCERNTAIARLPVELLPEFNENVKIWAQALLDQTDAWARQRELAEGVVGHPKTARVIVEVFAAVEPNAPGRVDPSLKARA